MLCILSTISSGDLARELKEGPALADGAILLQPARGELIRGVVNFHVAFRPGLEATFLCRSEERRSTGGEDTHGSRGGGVYCDWFPGWRECVLEPVFLRLNKPPYLVRVVRRTPKSRPVDVVAIARNARVAIIAGIQ